MDVIVDMEVFFFWTVPPCTNSSNQVAPPFLRTTLRTPVSSPYEIVFASLSLCTMVGLYQGFVTHGIFSWNKFRVFVHDSAYLALQVCQCMRKAWHQPSRCYHCSVRQGEPAAMVSLYTPMLSECVDEQIYQHSYQFSLCSFVLFA